MPSFTRLAVLAVAAGVLTAGTAQAVQLDGFFPRRGHGGVALNFTSESYDEFWVGETKVSEPALGEVETRTLSLWARYGVTDRLQIVAVVPHVDVEGDGTAGFSDSGLQDASVLVGYRLVERRGGALRHTLAVGAGGRTPLSDYEANAPVSLGDGSTDGLLRLVYQLRGNGWFGSQQLGFDLRGDDVPDGFPLVTRVGYSWGRVSLTGYYSLYIADGGTDIGDPGFTFPSNQDEFERLGASLYARLWQRLGVSAALFTTLDGRNSGDTDGVSIGLVYGF